MVKGVPYEQAIAAGLPGAELIMVSPMVMSGSSIGVLCCKCGGSAALLSLQDWHSPSFLHLPSPHHLLRPADPPVDNVQNGDAIIGPSTLVFQGIAEGPMPWSASWGLGLWSRKCSQLIFLGRVII